MILIDHFFFFCIITNSLHPASNYLRIFFFFLDTRKSFSCQLCVWSVSAWLLTPIFLRFKLCVCIYIDCCLLPEMYVCTCLPTPFSAGELELPWRPTNEQCFKGNIFHYVFVSSFFFSQVGCAFSFAWSGNRITQRYCLRLPLVFSLLLLPKVFECCGGWCRWRGLRKAFNFVLTALCPRGSVLEAQHTCFRETLFS